MTDAKVRQGRIVVARDTIRKLRPRDRVVDAVRELVGIDADLIPSQDDYISGRIADRLDVTLAEAVETRAIRGARAKDNGTPKRNAKQEAACRSADVAWCEVKRLAGIPSDPKRSHPGKRSRSHTGSGAPAAVVIPKWLFRELTKCGAKPLK
jgi:hypothetical protein